MASVTHSHAEAVLPTPSSGSRISMLIRAGIVLGALLVAVVLWQLTARPVDITVDGLTEQITTHRTTVGDLLLDLGIQVGAHDTITPAPDSPIQAGMQLTVERARPMRIIADGQDLTVATRGATPRLALADAGIRLDTHDLVLIDGVAMTVDDPLPAVRIETAAPTFDRGFAWDSLEAQPLLVRVQRAVPMVVDEGGLPYTVDTTAQTVGEALRQAEVVLYLGDRVQPSLGSRVISGMHVYIERSVPVSVQADGRQVKTRTQAKTVGDALTDLGVTVANEDRVTPALDSPLYDNVKIAITRIHEDVEVEEEIAPYETVFVGDPNLAIDTQEVLDPGANGITRTRYRVKYEDGVETSRVREDRWTAQEPAERRIAYGQSIIPQTAFVDGTPITYWRKFKAYATSYHPAALGGDSTTATGATLTKGIVAVDPRIIPLGSPMFVPGYGQGSAEDTGGGIISRRIDLGFDDSNYVSTSKWVDVYLLWPPPNDGIAWVLPNYPPVPE